MAKKVYYSFHYELDHWRVQQVQQMGVLEGQQVLSPQKWEEVKGGGDAAIRKWIADQMAGKSCLVCLIGRKTSERDWVTYEVKKAWADGKGVVGIYIHGLKNQDGNQTTNGSNPFASILVGNPSKWLSSIVTAHDPPYSTSTYVYDNIKEKLPGLVDAAISIRNNWSG